MLELKFIRENIDLVRQAIEKRQDTAPLDEILQLDSERRQRILELEDLRHGRTDRRNTCPAGAIPLGPLKHCGRPPASAGPAAR